jgi:hypothetical protein
MKTYYSHIEKAKASDYNLTFTFESLQQDDLRGQGGVVLFLGFDSR